MVIRQNTDGPYPQKAEHCLSGQARLIARLRASDPVFVEVCEDYELLVRELNTLPETARADRKLILDSLQGLVREMETSLRRALDASDQKPLQEHKTGDKE
jgi:hypothetical protein